MKSIKIPRVKTVERLPSTFEEAYRHERYGQYLKTDEDQRKFAKGLMDTYWLDGIATKLMKGRISPRKLIATQKFVEKKEYRLIAKLMERGEYDTPAVVEMHPRYLPGMGLVIDGHNRSKWNALHDVEDVEVYMIVFPHHDEEVTGYCNSAAHLMKNGRYLMVENMPIRKGNCKDYYTLFTF